MPGSSDIRRASVRRAPRGFRPGTPAATRPTRRRTRPTRGGAGNHRGLATFRTALLPLMCPPEMIVGCLSSAPFAHSGFALELPPVACTGRIVRRVGPLNGDLGLMVFRLNAKHGVDIRIRLSLRVWHRRRIDETE